MSTVYIDVLFLINFSLDFMTLYLTGLLYRFHPGRGRLIIASLLLSFYALWALLYCRYYGILLFTALFAAIAACMWVYRIHKIRRLLCVTFVFSGIGALLGAGVYLLYRFLSHFIPFSGSSAGGGMKILVFIVLAGVSGILIYFGNRLITDVRGVTSVVAAVQMCGKTGTVNLLVDTGNLVRDPLSGRRVVFLSLHVARRMFGNSVTELTYMSERRRWICIDTAAGHESLQAFLPEEMTVEGRQIEALIAIHSQADFHGYDGLFPAALLT